MRPRLMVLVLLLASPAVSWARDKTDVIYFTNGDSIHCEIKELKRGKLTVKSIGFGTIHIEWDKIAHIESDFVFQLELQSGVRYVGPITPAEESGQLEVATVSGTNRLDNARIVVIEPVHETFFNSIDGAIDIGYDFTTAADSTSWSLSAETKYRRPKYEVDLTFDSLYKTQNEADPVDRQDVTGSYRYLLQNRWFLFGLGQAGKNANQSLVFRGFGGGGAGRQLFHTNRTTITAVAGLGGSREKFTDTEFLTSMELIGGFFFDTFRFNTPEMQITTGLLVLPSVTKTDRVRLQFNGRVRLELIKDFFWQVAMFETFDSNPPSETAQRNDFGLTTSFGWTF